MESRIRVYELAKEMLVDSKMILRILSQIGYSAKNHMSTMDTETAQKVRDILTGKVKISDFKEIKESRETKDTKQTKFVPKAGTQVAQKPTYKGQRQYAKPQQQPVGGFKSERAPGSSGQSTKAPLTKQTDWKAKPKGQGSGYSQNQAQSVAKPQGGPKAPERSSRKNDNRRGGPRGGPRQSFDRRRSQPRGRGPQTKVREMPAKQPKQVVLESAPISVKDLGQKLGINAAEIIKRLMSLGVMASINQDIDADSAAIIAGELGFEVTQKPPELTLEDKLKLEFSHDDPEKMVPRPAVVTVMGHVDHGKTSLLDAIRKTNITAQEQGGITQHIGASAVEWDGKRIVFLDTPGHEAFTSMRARGAKVTDVAVLVVAADDGVMPQTIEAINHAKAAKVPIIVAINKIDKASAKPDMVKQQLVEYGLVPEEWGGDTICVPVSARTKAGIDKILEMILLVAEIQELKADPTRNAQGVVIEAQLDKGRGPVASVLIQNGTLKVGDSVIVGSTFGKVRAMTDDRRRRVKKAGPSSAVEVVGLADVPDAGDIIQAVSDERLVRDLASQRQATKRAGQLQATGRMNLEDFLANVKEGEIAELNLILKVDVQGSAEAIKQALSHIQVPGVKINIIHTGVGSITESDVMLASASNAVVIGFNVRPDNNGKRVGEIEKVDIRTYRIIYDLVDEIESAMKGLLKPKVRENVIGRVEIRAIFKVPKVGTIAGCYVTDGKITKSSNVRVIRDGVVVFEGSIASLKRFKDDVREVAQGYECGVGVERFQDIKEGDILEAYVMEEVKPA